MTMRAWAHSYEGSGRKLRVTAEQLSEVANDGDDSDDSAGADAEGRPISRGRQVRKYLSAISAFAKTVSDAEFLTHGKSFQNAISEKFNNTLDLDLGWIAGREAVERATAAIVAREAVESKKDPKGPKGPKDQKDAKGAAKPAAAAQPGGTAPVPCMDAFGKMHPSRAQASRANVAAGLPPATKHARLGAGPTPAAPAAPAAARPVAPAASAPAAAARVAPPAAAPAAAAGPFGPPRPPAGPPPPTSGPSVCFGWTQHGHCPWGAACRFKAQTPGHP